MKRRTVPLLMLAVASLTAAALTAGEKFTLRDLDTGETRRVELTPLVEPPTPDPPPKPEPEPDPGEVPPPPGPEPAGPYPIIEGSHAVPDLVAYPTLVSVQSGDAADPATWGGRLPVPGDRVVIRPEHVVTITDPETPTVCKAIGNHGELHLRDGGTLRVKDAINYGDGLWTATGEWEIVIRDIAIDKDRDFSEWGTGFLNRGDLDLEGEYVQGWEHTVGPIKAGDTSITLRGPPVNWQAGDEIAIPRTAQTLVWAENERNRIKAIDGAVVTLETPVAFEHPVVQDAAGEVLFTPVVANLHRSGVIRSENPDGTRGHTLDTGHGTSRFENVALAELSRTLAQGFGEVTKGAASQVARYIRHQHHCHGEPGSTVNCVIDLGDKDRNLRWGHSLHASHGWLTEGNTYIGWNDDAHLVTEDGYETGHRIYGNLTINGAGGYWLNGPEQYFDGNLAMGHGTGIHIGFNLRGEHTMDPNTLLTLPVDPLDPHGEKRRVLYRNLTTRSYKGNTVVGGFRGETQWEVGDGGNPTVSEGLNIYHCREGVAPYYAFEAIYKDTTILGEARWAGKELKDPDKRPYSRPSYGVNPASANTRHYEFHNAVIQNAYTGVSHHHRGEHVKSLWVKPDLRNIGVNWANAYWQQQPYGVTHVVEPTFGGPAPIDLEMKLGDRLQWTEDVLLVTLGGRHYRLYGDYQRADYVVPNRDNHSGHAGKTNQQLVDAGLTPLGGALVPPDAKPGTEILGPLGITTEGVWVEEISAEELRALLDRASSQSGEAD